MRIEKTEQGKTKNGLRYYLFPRTGFGEQMAAVLVQRGANHLFWKGREGEKICFPQGTAHFIEHKLFQQEWGDAFARFTQNGASANAFTDGLAATGQTLEDFAVWLAYSWLDVLIFAAVVFVAVKLIGRLRRGKKLPKPVRKKKNAETPADETKTEE